MNVLLVAEGRWSILEFATFAGGPSTTPSSKPESLEYSIAEAASTTENWNSKGIATSLIPREGEPVYDGDADIPLTTLWDAW